MATRVVVGRTMSRGEVDCGDERLLVVWSIGAATRT